MDLNLAQLDALVAIAEHGSFDAAARYLHLTPSAVSQRIRALETTAGQVLVTRAVPCRPTAHGERLVEVGRRMRLLQDEAAADLGVQASVELPVVVNADSLATWFGAVFAEAATWPATALRLRVEDQAYSQDLLRRGEVLAAVTSEPAPVQGCSVEALGAQRYLPVAAPALAAAWRQGRRVDWAAMPMLTFNAKDDLQHDLLRRHGVDVLPPVVHQVPTTADFLTATLHGLGWSLLPEAQAGPDLAAGRLVRLSRDVTDVPLYWQRWRLTSPRLDRLTAAVRTAAKAGLRRVSGR